MRAQACYRFFDPAGVMQCAKTALVYDRNFLLWHRNSSCHGIPRWLRRRLFSFKILNRQPNHQCSPKTFAINTRITRRIPGHQVKTPLDRRPALVYPTLLITNADNKRASKVSEQPTIMITNARSIRNKFDELLLTVKKAKPGLAIITETWLDVTTDSSWLEIPQYRTLRKDRDHLGGGILVYVDEAFQTSKCNCSSVSSFPSSKTEFLTFFINHSMLVIVLYHPYWGDTTYHEIAIDKIIDLVSHGRKEHSITNVLICGDFNDLGNFVDDINAVLGLESLFELPTRNDRQLDFVLTSCKDAYLDSFILPPLANSDHSVIVCRARSILPRPKVSKIKFRKKTPAACENFRVALSENSSLNEVLFVSNAETAAAHLISELSHLFNVHFPLRTIRVRSDDKPWVKPSLKILVNARDRAYAQKKTLKYLRLRKAVSWHVRKLKQEFLLRGVCSNSHAKTWKSINELLHRRRKPVTADADALCELFSKNFSNSDLNDVSTNSLHSAPMTVTLHEVTEVMRSLKKGSPGPDEIPYWILRDYTPLLAPLVHHVISLSFSSGLVPNCFKVANVIPIPKSGQPAISDFRPISLLSMLNKVMEKIVFRKWLSKISSLIGPSQFAFIPRNGQGTTPALTFIVHHILSFLDSPGAVRMLMLDFQKAFDKIPHQVVVKSLITKGASRELVCWIISYLSSRKQRVICNGKCSKWYDVVSGVPQGSVLSPLLFALSVDSLQPKFENSIMVKFADDVSLLHFIRNEEDDRLSEELNHITNWSCAHGMGLNYTKTKLMNFQTKRSLNLSVLCDPNTKIVIETVSSAKILGIFLDDKLTWKPQACYALTRARKRIYMLHSLKQARPPQKLLWLVYCTMIRSVLTYAYPAWCGMVNTRFRSFVKLEKRLSNLFDFTCRDDLANFCYKTASKLAEKAKDPRHPLHFIFDKSACRYSSRLGSSHRLLKTKTVRFKNSFIRFA